MGTISTKPKKGHSTRAHAMLSASGASRWINCTPSAKLEEEYGRPGPSVYAAEGTLAHEISELFIQHDIIGNIDDNSFNIKLEEFMNNELFKEEMLDVLPIYVDYCSQEYKAALEYNSMATIEIEQKLNLTEFVPESFGTADCIIINDDVMEVIDLKYGKGIPVYAQHNKQLMLYGLGALRKYDTLYDIKEVKLTIIQPRINNISTWMISVDELLRWAIEELKPAAEKAFRGEGELKAGDWCRFCAIKNKCKALADENLSLAKHEFKKPELLTEDEIADILVRAPKLVEWANSITEYALKRALEGQTYNGFKLVEGRSLRKWVDEDLAAQYALARMPELSEDQIFDTKLKSISQLEKIVGKKRFAELMEDAVIKPQGKPTLVPLSDKRPALGIDEAVNDFKE